MSLGLLSASVAHELNTPLAVLNGSIEKLIETTRRFAHAGAAGADAARGAAAAPHQREPGGFLEGAQAADGADGAAAADR